MGHRLSDTEALLWSLGKDPNLASTMGLVVVLAKPPDPARVRATVAATVAAVDRMQQKIAEPATGTGRPEWTLDPEFELDHHLRFTRLTGRDGGRATMADLRSAATRFVNDPFDLGRPLWQFQLFSGLPRGRTALVTKVHHSISDGLGMLRLAGNLLEFEAEAEPPEPVELDRVFRPDSEAVAGDDTGHDGHGEVDAENTGNGDGLFDRLHAATRNLSALPSPAQLVEAGAEVVNTARVIGSQLPKADSAPLWAGRSRNRRLEFTSVPTAALKARARDLEVTLNTLFVAACAEGALAYHRSGDVELDSVSATVVVSTRPPDPDQGLGGAGDNAFVPVALRIPGRGATQRDRLDVIRDEVARRREQLSGSSNLLSAIGALTGLMPQPMAANLTKQQAAKVDFATSNVPGLPVPTWFAGRAVDALYPVGPVSGTACNITLLTFDTRAGIGIHVDPAAVADSDLLRRSIERGFTELGVARR